MLLLLAKTNESTQVCVPVQQTKLIQHTDDLNHKDMRIHSSKKSGLPVPRREKKVEGRKMHNHSIGIDHYH